MERDHHSRSISHRTIKDLPSRYHHRTCRGDTVQLRLINGEIHCVPVLRTENLLQDMTIVLHIGHSQKICF